VSGDEKESGPPTSARFAKEPGLVPCFELEGFWAPRSGRVRSIIANSVVQESRGTKHAE
jgi:hypothetical protein